MAGGLFIIRSQTSPFLLDRCFFTSLQFSCVTAGTVQTSRSEYSCDHRS